MSRFNNLELGGESEERSEPSSSIRDEAFYLREAQSAYESAEFDRGLRAYARVLEHNPANPIAWSGQVRMLIELGEPEEARLWADKALERFPQDPEILAAKGVALGRLGDVDDALAFSDASVEERGDTPYIWLARADVFLARKEKRAEFSFEKAFSQSPGSWFVHWLAARIRCHYRQYALALRCASAAVRLDPGMSVAWLQSGLCQQELGLIADATASIDRALELNPRSEEAEAARRALANVGGWAGLRRSLRRLFSS